MTAPTRSRPQPWTPLVIGTVLLAQGLTFAFFAVLHAGIPLLGIDQPAIVPAAIPESLCALATLGAGMIVMTRRGWAPSAAIGGQALAVAGVLAGIASQIGDPNATELNVIYLRIMLAVLLAGIAVVLVPAVRRALTPVHAR